MRTDKMIADKEGGLGWIVFNNPERHNAVSLEMWQAMVEILDDFIRDPDVRVILVRGAGEKSFISGADISKFGDERAEAAAVERYNQATEAAYKGLMNSPKPTIAMIQGHCIGGGTNLAICCDMRICSDNARFAIPAAKLGLGYDYPRVRRLMNLVGPAFAAEIFFTARHFTAEEAYEMGLVNRIVPKPELSAYVSDYAKAIADNAPLTIKAIKRSIAESLKDATDRDLAGAERLVQDCFASQDYTEGRLAFMEKRKPVFTGS